MKITKENHKGILVAQRATETKVKLEMINGQLNSFLHNPFLMEIAKNEVVIKMRELRDLLEGTEINIKELVEEA